MAKRGDKQFLLPFSGVILVHIICYFCKYFVSVAILPSQVNHFARSTISILLLLLLLLFSFSTVSIKRTYLVSLLNLRMVFLENLIRRIECLRWSHQWECCSMAVVYQVHRIPSKRKIEIKSMHPQSKQTL